MSKRDVFIVEVGPRDGLQNEKVVIPTQNKIQFIKDLKQAGLYKIEATSFVRRERIPQMGDGKDVFKGLTSENDLSLFPVLVPNKKGFETAKELGVKEISIFTATSETFNQKNINASIDESLERFNQFLPDALKLKMRVRAYISTVFGCPYEGKIHLTKTIELVEKLKKMGVHEISLGDTIGVGTPNEAEELISLLKSSFNLSEMAMHFHDTYGMAVANVLRSYEKGIRIFDSSAGGLGGCPYAKGATGNVGTEDLVYLFDGLGVETGVEKDKVAHASHKIFSLLDRQPNGRVSAALWSKRREP